MGLRQVRALVRSGFKRDHQGRQVVVLALHNPERHGAQGTEGTHTVVRLCTSISQGSGRKRTRIHKGISPGSEVRRFTGGSRPQDPRPRLISDWAGHGRILYFGSEI